MKKLIILLVLVSIATAAVFAQYLWPTATFPLEVDEPIEILEYSPMTLNMFPGQTEDITITIMNHAPLNYSIVLDFQLNDTHYQESYVTFSSEVYNVGPGEQTLGASLSIDSHAPSITATVTIEVERVQRPDGSGDSLYTLPANALLGDHRTYYEAELLRIDVDPAPGDQQETSVSTGQTVNVDLTLQIWEPRGPSIINQALMIFSWSPTWPPTSEYYAPLYHGTPGYHPGVTVNRAFTFTAPSSPGEYYLWFCAAEQYSMEDAAGTFTESPVLPAHARIIVT
jgi:hypothetical protein